MGSVQVILYNSLVLDHPSELYGGHAFWPADARDTWRSAATRGLHEETHLQELFEELRRPWLAFAASYVSKVRPIRALKGVNLSQ